MHYQQANETEISKLQNETEELKKERGKLRRTIDALRKTYNEQCKQQSGNPSSKYIEMTEKLGQNESLRSELERVTHRLNELRIEVSYNVIMKMRGLWKY